MSIKNPQDFWTGLAYIVFGSSAVFIARDYGMGTAFKMGPAYFPAVLGGLLILVGLTSLVRSFLKPGDPVGAFTLKGLALVLGSTLLFGFVVRGAGLAVAVPLVVIVSASASTRFRWAPSLLLAAGLAAFCSIVFLKGLGVPLPILGPWFSE